MIVVCFGDSITAGQFVAPEHSWPRLLTGHTVIVRAVPGDTTRLGLERFPQVQEIRPDAVVIQFGHNDANRWDSDRGLPRVSLAAYEANLHELVARAQHFGIRPYLVTLTPTWKAPLYDATCETYDAVLRRVAGRTGAALIDVRERITSRGFLLDDGLHLNPTGHQVYAARVQAALG